MAEKPAEWGIMTDRERAAWTAKNEAPVLKAKPAYNPTSSVESQIEEQRQRKGQYNVKKPAEHWWQTTDGHQ
jgi:hypothetical protein